MNSDPRPEREPAAPGEFVLIRRTLITTAWLGALACLVAWTYWGGSRALAILAGLVLGSANLVFLTALVREFVRLGERDAVKIAVLFASKMLVVYGGLAALLLTRRLSVLALVGGFSLPLAVIVLKAGGRALQATRLFRTADGRLPADGRAAHAGKG